MTLNATTASLKMVEYSKQKQSSHFPHRIYPGPQTTQHGSVVLRWNVLAGETKTNPRAVCFLQDGLFSRAHMNSNACQGFLKFT